MWARYTESEPVKTSVGYSSSTLVANDLHVISGEHMNRGIVVPSWMLRVKNPIESSNLRRLLSLKCQVACEEDILRDWNGAFSRYAPERGARTEDTVICCWTDNTPNRY